MTIRRRRWWPKSEVAEITGLKSHARRPEVSTVRQIRSQITSRII